MLYTFLLISFIILENNIFSYGGYDKESKASKYEISSDDYGLDCNETFSIPTNNICSIAYLLYTDENKNSPCYLEPNSQDFNQCSFDPYRETKILIHGYTVKLKPGNIFELIKDTLLSTYNCNVIIVNWTKYNQGEYNDAVENAYLTGIEVGKFVSFLKNKKGQNPTDIHIIGHSLGAHVAGVAGKQVPDLGRISGLDPAAPLYKLKVTYNRLTDRDAKFVDVIHCSNGVIANLTKGYGIPFPIGDINFYPNGGIYQPSCIIGRNFTNADGVTSIIKSNNNLISCRHNICPIYFLYSIRDCKFLSKQCYSYKRYNMGKCFSKSHLTDMMGLHAEKIPGLPSHSKFYLSTASSPPYC